MVKIDNLLSPDDASAILKVSRRTVDKFLRDGSLKGSKIGRFWRIKRKDLDDFIEGERGTGRLRVHAEGRVYSRKGSIKTMNVTNIGKKKPPRARRSKKQPVESPVFKCPDVIQLELSAELRDFIVQAIASGEFGSPDEVVSASIDEMMKSEGFVV